MTKNIFEMQAEFLRAGEVEFPVCGELPIATVLVDEEFEEWAGEQGYATNGNLNDLKEVCDLIYVAAQYLNESVGPEKAQQLFDAVHSNNMGKCIDGKLVKREDGKIMKPDEFDKMGWVVPFEEILRDTTDLEIANKRIEELEDRLIKLSTSTTAIW